MNGDLNTPVVKLVIFIVDWSKIKIISTIFAQSNLRYHFVCKGAGTASSEILDILGIGATNKAVILCLEQDMMIPSLMNEVGRKLGLNHPGTGIGFSIPLSAINNPILKLITEDAAAAFSVSVKTGENEAEKDEKQMARKFDLIVSILNQGYSDEFMTAARGAGAGGGTVINARGLSKTGPAKIFGISVQNEKEIIIILTTREKKEPIMEAVSKSHGQNSKAEGIVFSVPADNITGIELH
jgi:nitrogen regulatory protein PII